MNAIEQSPSYNQQYSLSLPASPHNRYFINGISVLEYKHPISVLKSSNQVFESENPKKYDTQHSYSEYRNSWLFSADLSEANLDKKNELVFKNMFSVFSRKNQASQSTQHKKMENQTSPFQSSQIQPKLDLASQNQFVKVAFHSDIIVLLSERSQVIYDKPLKDLKDRINQVHEDHQEEGWDGYGAKPIQNLSQALQFAEALFQESRLLVEQVDIIPENDGAICFEWFVSYEQYVSVSVKNDKLIYHYQIGEEKGCGETNMAGKQMLFEKIKKTG